MWTYTARAEQASTASGVPTLLVIVSNGHGHQAAKHTAVKLHK
jgi:hypothetical protein